MQSMRVCFYGAFVTIDLLALPSIANGSQNEFCKLFESRAILLKDFSYTFISGIRLVTRAKIKNLK